MGGGNGLPGGFHERQECAAEENEPLLFREGGISRTLSEGTPCGFCPCTNAQPSGRVYILDVKVKCLIATMKRSHGYLTFFLFPSAKANSHPFKPIVYIQPAAVADVRY